MKYRLYGVSKTVFDAFNNVSRDVLVPARFSIKKLKIIPNVIINVLRLNVVLKTTLKSLAIKKHRIQQ